jgi:hypothetical protein
MPAPVVINSETELLAAIRARVAELDISYDTLDHIAGLPARFASKLLCDPPNRQISQATLWLLMGAIGLKIELIEDPEAYARVQSRLVKRVGANARHITPLSLARRRKSPWLFDAVRSQLANKLRNEILSPQRRVAIARKAARHRWKRVVRRVYSRSEA